MLLIIAIKSAKKKINKNKTKKYNKYLNIYLKIK